MEIDSSKKAPECFFGENLKFLRKRQKLSLIALSELLDISKSALSDYENGKFLPSVLQVQKVANHFKVTIDQLLNSKFSEKSKSEERRKALTGDTVQDPAIADFENEKYALNLRLLNQKLESTYLQIQLIKQLLESRESENKTLKLNITLLEEQLNKANKDNQFI